VHFHCRQILLSTRQAAAQHRHGAGGAGHPLRLRQLSQQPGDQGRAAAHPPPSMDATPATSASTTMPTLNKVKPSSGARAALTNGQDKSNIFVPESLRFPI